MCINFACINKTNYVIMTLPQITFQSSQFHSYKEGPTCLHFGLMAILTSPVKGPEFHIKFSFLPWAIHSNVPRLRRKNQTVAVLDTLSTSGGCCLQINFKKKIKKKIPSPTSWWRSVEINRWTFFHLSKILYIINESQFQFRVIYISKVGVLFGLLL